MIAAAFAAWLLWRTWRHRTRLKREAMSELARISQAWSDHGDSHRLTQELSVLLRRVYISACPRAGIAGATGERWLHLLDRSVETRQPFSAGEGRVLAKAPYSPAVAVDADALLKLCEQAIRSLATKRRRRRCAGA